MNNRTWLIAGVAVLAVALAVVMIIKSTASDGVNQSNIANFAKSIDNTKGNTPSVPPERLALGRTGGKGGVKH
jgi:hypothetical protein